MNAAYSEKDLLADVGEWLKFAEAKNAALIAFSGISLPYMLSKFSDDSNLLQAYLWVCVPLLLCSLFLSLVSFIPQLDPFKKLQIFGDTSPNRQISIFFGDIAAMEFSDFSRQASGVFGFEREDQLTTDILHQIHINSQIATKKYKFFSLSILFLIAGLFTPFSCLALLIMKKNLDI